MSTSLKLYIIAKLINLLDIQSFRSRWTKYAKVVEFTTCVSVLEVIIYSFRATRQSDRHSWDLR